MLNLLLASSDPVSHVVQQGYKIGQGFWQFPIWTNHIFMQLMAAGLLIWLLPLAVQQRRGRDEVGRLVPRGGGNMIEAVCLALRDNIFRPSLGPYTDRFTPFLWSMFFFIATVNILGMIPLGDWFSWVPGHWVGGTATGNIFTTAGLALITFVLVVYNGLKLHGVEYVKHFFMGPWYLSWFIGLLEIMGLFFKMMALCVRLFANMLAGHMILAVLLTFIPMAFKSMGTVGGAGVTLGVILGSIAFNFLEILVAFLHAFIFTALTAVFLGQAVNIHHAHADDHAHGDGHTEPAGHGQARAAVPAH